MCAHTYVYIYIYICVRISVEVLAPHPPAARPSAAHIRGNTAPCEYERWEVLLGIWLRETDKTSGCHCTAGHLTSRDFTED